MTDSAILYLLIDRVYLKPRTRIDIILQIAPLDPNDGAFLKTVEDRAIFQVATDCIRQEINKKVGYEANLAQIGYSVSKFGEMGLCLSFDGYSDKLLDFGALFLE